MAKRPQVLSEEEILQKTQEKSQKSVGWYDSRLSRERTRVIRYYNGALPARQHDGSSSYVSTDVYDAVELAKAQILEVFSGSDEIAQFDPDQDMKQKTAAWLLSTRGTSSSERTSLPPRSSPASSTMGSRPALVLLSATGKRSTRTRRKSSPTSTSTPQWGSPRKRTWTTSTQSNSLTAPTRAPSRASTIAAASAST
jgi:hypothetical protein